MPDRDEEHAHSHCWQAVLLCCPLLRRDLLVALRQDWHWKMWLFLSLLSGLSRSHGPGAGERLLFHFRSCSLAVCEQARLVFHFCLLWPDYWYAGQQLRASRLERRLTVMPFVAWETTRADQLWCLL